MIAKLVDDASLCKSSAINSRYFTESDRLQPNLSDRKESRLTYD
ncbi:hypothetical protein [Chlorogloeopsis sp. ULAP02]